MISFTSKSRGACFGVLLLAGSWSSAQQDAPVAAQPAKAAAASPAHAPERIGIDVLVTGKDGKLVADLEPPDFALFDNGQPRKILNFRRTDGAAGNRIDPPVEVIILLDAVNLSYQAVTLQRLKIEEFLRRNDGHLAQPTSLFLFSSQGLRVQPAPSRDGNALAKALDDSTGTVRARDLSGGIYSLLEQFKDSFKTMNGIAENEARKPGRKILIWIGPGWPLLTERYFIQNSESRQSYFEQLIALSNKLREARVTVYNVAPVVGITRNLYTGYLKPVTDFHKMEIGDLALEVLAVHTGGRVLDPSNDLPGLLADCIADIGPYYTLTFAAPPAAHPGEYNELRVQVGQPGMTARTISGYYHQP